MNRGEIHAYVYEATVVVALCSLPFSRWLSSAALFVLLINWVVEGKYKRKFQHLSKNNIAVALLMFFGITAAGYFYSADKTTAGFELQKKAALLFVPLALGSISLFDKERMNRVLLWFTASTLSACVFCLSAAFLNYRADGSAEHFFYHSLGKPLGLHAVYLSVFIYVAVIFLLNSLLSEMLSTGRKVIYVLMSGTLSVFLLLLSSKLVIITFSASLPLLFLFHLSKRINVSWISGFLIGFSILLCTVLFTDNKISLRFKDIGNNNLALLQRQSFERDMYFDGLSFRLLVWRFGAEIVKEQNAWLNGVGCGDAQLLLNNKIAASGMYTGEAERGDKGYLDYNFHNQFMEAFVKSGILGFLALLSIFLLSAIAAIRTKSPVYLFFLVIFFCFCITESVFERQLGVVPFAIISTLFANLCRSSPVMKNESEHTNNINPSAPAAGTGQ